MSTTINPASLQDSNAIRQALTDANVRFSEVPVSNDFYTSPVPQFVAHLSPEVCVEVLWEQGVDPHQYDHFEIK